eukprot:g15752.t1
MTQRQPSRAKSSTKAARGVWERPREGSGRGLGKGPGEAPGAGEGSGGVRGMAWEGSVSGRLGKGRGEAPGGVRERARDGSGRGRGRGPGMEGLRRARFG